MLLGLGVVTSVLISPASGLWSKSLVIDGQAGVRFKEQACTPGYWKAHPEAWNGTYPDHTGSIDHALWFNATFLAGVDPALRPDISGFSNSGTLLDAVGTGGGEEVALGRHAAAQLANASALEAGNLLGYRYSVAEVIAIYRDAVGVDPGDLSISTGISLFEAAEGETTGDVECPLEGLRAQSEGRLDVPSVVASALWRLVSVDTAEAQEGLTAFEEAMGIGRLPDIPAECQGMTFDKVFVIDGPRTYESVNLRDLIFGSGGSDVIKSAGGDDCIVGNGGADQIDSGTGNDVALGGDGDDWLYGLKGNDRLYGGAGSDRIKGGDGDDAIDGGSGTDLCTGGAGTNALASCEASPGPGGLRASYRDVPPAVILAWQPVAGATSYTIYVSTTGGAYAFLGSSALGSYEHSGVQPGTYYYVVTAVDVEGFESAPSAVATILIAPPMPTPTASPMTTAVQGSPTATPLASTPAPSTTLEPTSTPSPTSTAAATSTPGPTSTPTAAATSTP